jgi:tRNA(Ile)-lysidine synthase
MSKNSRNSSNVSKSNTKIEKSKKNISVKIYDDFIENTLNKINKFFIKNVFPDENTKFLLGVSGGIDSIVMLDIFYILAHKYNYDVFVAHFNHKLRGSESDKDIEFVRNLSSDYGFEFHSGAGNVKGFSEKNNISTELSARTLRYNFFERTSRNLNVDFVATAHHKDDVAETFFINLIRGSGLTGLSGIPSVRKFVKNVRIIRPMLDLSKKDIENYASIRNLKWREDHTNKLSLYTRNRIRNDFIPQLKENFSDSIIDTINRAAKHINGADEFISAYVTNQITKIIEYIEPETISLSIYILNTYSDFIKGEVIKAVLDKYFKIINIDLNSIYRIIGLLESDTGALIELKENIVAVKERDVIIFYKKTATMDYYEKITVPGEYRIGKFKLKLTNVNKRQIKFLNNSNVEYISEEFLPHYLEIRNWRSGDSFQPIGMNGTMNVSDFLTNIKVPTYQKQGVLVLTNQVDIIWVCGYRLSDKFKITENTRKAVKIELITL